MSEKTAQQEKEFIENNIISQLDRRLEVFIPAKRELGVGFINGPILGSKTLSFSRLPSVRKLNIAGVEKLDFKFYSIRAQFGTDEKVKARAKSFLIREKLGIFSDIYAEDKIYFATREDYDFKPHVKHSVGRFCKVYAKNSIEVYGDVERGTELETKNLFITGNIGNEGLEAKLPDPMTNTLIKARRMTLCGKIYGDVTLQIARGGSLLLKEGAELSDDAKIMFENVTIKAADLKKLELFKTGEKITEEKITKNAKWVSSVSKNSGESKQVKL